MAFVDSGFESVFFNQKYLPSPPLQVRLGLASGQVLKYSHLSLMDKIETGLLRRIFKRQETWLEKEYFEEIMSKVQFMKFMGK
jgi:hypothetical protein